MKFKKKDYNSWEKLNKVSSTIIDGYIRESGISTIILNMGIDLEDELQGLMNTDSISLTNSTTTLMAI